jgi:hypothetical protein
LHKRLGHNKCFDFFLIFLRNDCRSNHWCSFSRPQPGLRSVCYLTACLTSAVSTYSTFKSSAVNRDTMPTGWPGCFSICSCSTRYVLSFLNTVTRILRFISEAINSESCLMCAPLSQGLLNTQGCPEVLGKLSTFAPAFISRI